MITMLLDFFGDILVEWITGVLIICFVAIVMLCIGELFDWWE